jgi:hypothetical protein
MFNPNVLDDWQPAIATPLDQVFYALVAEPTRAREGEDFRHHRFSYLTLSNFVKISGWAVGGVVGRGVVFLALQHIASQPPVLEVALLVVPHNIHPFEP